MHAVKKLHRLDRPFLVLNGDTFFQVPLKDLSLKGDCTIALHFVKNNPRYTGVVLSKERKLLSFNQPSSCLINGGCYLFHPSALSSFTVKVLSLEKDLIPKLTCFGKTFQVPFIDIGIPEDYQRASKVVVKNLEKQHIL